MEVNSFNCFMCSFSTTEYDRFVTHVVRSHRHDPNFVVYCGYPNCPYTTKAWGAFKSHVSRKHKLTTAIENNNCLPDDDGMEIDENNEHIDPIQYQLSVDEQKKLCMGKYSLTLEAEHNMTQRAVNDVLVTTSTLIQQNVEIFRQRVQLALTEQGLPADFLSEIDTDTFAEEFITVKRRDKFYTENYNLLNPEEVKLGSKFVTVRGQLVSKPQMGYIVPFKENLQRFLSLPEVWHFIQTGHKSRSSLMRDVGDGSYIVDHELFSRNKTALQIIIHTDDIEVVNPIGSHTKKHKLSMFYFTLANIPPEHRSRLTCIQLIAVAKARDTKNLHAGLLKDFIDTVKALATGGIPMEINGDILNIEGTLVMAACDTPAANWLGGFKEGVAFALKACRRCSASGKDMKIHFNDRHFPLRNDTDHREKCETLQQLGRETRQYWSKMWGINSGSVLMDIPGFSICSGLVQDPMHLLLEGIVPYEFRIMLYHFVHVEKYFTLRWLNARLSSFSYSYLEAGSKPEKILSNHLSGTGKIKQTSAAMLTLCMVLPFVAGVKVPESDHRWQNFIRLVQITILATSPCCDHTTAGQLSQLIFDHNSNFGRLYPKVSIIPKMHYLIHLPLQMKNYGPLRNHWCMRFEGKHAYFKTKNIKCFKNLPKTLSLKHQKYMCHMQTNFAGQPSENFLYSGDIVSEGGELLFDEAFPDLKASFQTLANLTDDDKTPVYKTTQVAIHGHIYRAGCCLVLEYVEDVPIFGRLHTIVIKDDVKYFIVEELPILDFNSHILAFELEISGQLQIRKQTTLFSAWPLALHMYQGKWHVVNQYSHRAEYL